jgi:membrane fusion protein, multidrug efflux system
MIRLLAGAALIVVAAILITMMPVKSRHTKSNAPPSVLVQLTKLQKGGLPRIVTVFGKAEPTAAMQQNVTAPSTALVQGIFVKPGQEVKSGTAVIRLGPTPDTAAAYRKAVSALDNARGLLRRNKDLLVQHLATDQQVADARKAVADAQASLTALAAAGASKPRALLAPYDGVITSISATQGAIVNAGAALLSLARTSGLVLRAGAVPEQAKQIHRGDTAKVSALSGGDTDNGTVLLRGSIVDPSTGLVPVEISLSSGHFLAGQAAQARIVTGTVEGYVVPHKAVLVNNSGTPYVVQTKHMIAHHVLIRILLSSGSKDVIAGALDPRAALVLAGNYQLKDGMHARLANQRQADGK